jgi:iron transport multicopper oxidase
MEINGLGRFPGGPKGPLSVVEVTRGLRYRLRLINTACIAAFNVSIDSHTLTVIETDGSETKPHTVDRVSLFPGKSLQNSLCVWSTTSSCRNPGQRLSVIVKASQAVNNYCMCAQGI